MCMILSYKPEVAMSVVSVRMSRSERQLLEEAAGKTRASLSEFMRRSALEAAELALMERTDIVIPPEHWAAFEAFAKAPAREIPALAELARARPTWGA
jgi:uncharacterized protein (DUF1778 family)